MSLETLFQRAGVVFKEGGSHRNVRVGWIGIDCPWCGSEEGKYHLGISPNRTYAICWNCGWHHVTKVICEVLQVNYGQCLNLLQAADVKLDAVSQFDTPQVSGVLKLPKGIEPLGTRHRRYLKSRGFDPDELAAVWGIQGIGVNSLRLAWRIFIPIRIRKQTVSWTTRAIHPGAKSRYITASKEEEKVSCKHLLYGAELARDRVVVCEGPTDAWRIGPGAVSVLGLVVTPVQVELISRYAVRAICFDNSRKAQLRAERLADKLEMLPGETHLIQLDAEDPGSASDNEVRLIRKTIFQER